MPTKTKKYTSFRPLIYSRHPSHDCLRRENKNLPLLPFRSVVRLGSTTEHSKDRVECNTVEAVKTSSSKLRMKQAFTDSNVPSADWFKYDKKAGQFFKNGNTEERLTVEDMPYPIVAKLVYGSRGAGMQKIDDAVAMDAFLREEFENTQRSRYYFEQYLNYTREYRLHVTEDGCFYSCRKMLKSDTEEEERWFRNDSNCVWFLENNPKFDKPSNWKEIEEACVLALRAVGLDIGAVDLRVTSKAEGKKHKFAVLEINSAPSFGEVTQQKYFEEIPKVLKRKAKNS